MRRLIEFKDKNGCCFSSSLVAELMGERQLLGEGGKQRLILRIGVEGICCPKGTYAMKWSNRTAQAFRPGKAALEFALKGRPKQLGIMWRLIVVDNDTCRSKLAHSVALSGRLL